LFYKPIKKDLLFRCFFMVFLLFVLDNLLTLQLLDICKEKQSKQVTLRKSFQKRETFQEKEI